MNARTNSIMFQPQQPVAGFQLPSYLPPTLPMDSLNTQANAFMGIDPNRLNPANLSDRLMTPDFSAIVSAADGVGDGLFSQMKAGVGGALKDFGEWAKESGMIGSIDDKGVRTDGWGSMALNAAGGLASSYLGMKQYGLAKKTFAENKRQFDSNYAAQRTTTNSALEDRQRGRIASNPGAYQSVGDYMDKHGVR